MDTNCLICGLQTTRVSALSRHLTITHKMSPEIYTLQFLLQGQKPLCKCGCGQATKYGGKQYKFRDFIHNHHKPTLGIPNSPEKRKNISKALKSKYSSNPVAFEKAKKILLSNREKGLQELKEKTGHISFMHVEEVKEKLKQTCLDKYGYENGGCIERYSWDKILEKCKEKSYTPLFEEADYSNRDQEFKFLCNIHQKEFISKIRQVFVEENAQCQKCRFKGFSLMEKEMLEYVKSIYQGEIKENARDIIPPKELDIYIPDKQIAIEFNGLYWHSELHKDKKDAYNKFMACKDKNVKLIQFYEDEWRDKKDICKSIIENKLGLCKSKVFARETVLCDDLSRKEIDKFFNENHLQGKSQHVKAFALKNKEGEIVFALSLRRPFTKQNERVIEVARIASKANTAVPGALSRCLKYAVAWCKEQNYAKLLTYSDCRHSFGESYAKNCFVFVCHSGIGYGYTDFVGRFGRFKFRAQPGIPEKQIAEQNQVYKIYGPGNFKWEIPLS